jgi:hypothetical protein
MWVVFFLIYYLGFFDDISKKGTPYQNAHLLGKVLFLKEKALA